MVEIYLTKEQIQRIAALTLDSLVGAQIGSTVADDSIAYVVTCDAEDNWHYEVDADGTCRDVT